MGEAKRKRKSVTPSGFKLTKGSTTTTIIVLCILAVVGYDVYNRTVKSPIKSFNPARSKGNPQAALKVVEFADFQCPQCAKGAKLLSDYVDQYPEDIYIGMKYFPLGSLNSSISAIYAECAARQDKFWPFHDKLFDTQKSWSSLVNIKAYFQGLARESGVNVEELAVCIKKEDVLKTVMQERSLGESHFVKSTPTFFVNGEIVVGVQSLQQILDQKFN